MNSLELGPLLAQAMAWETDASTSGTGWVTWGVCFLVVVIGGGVSVLLRSRRPDSSGSAWERLSDADRFLQRQATPASPISKGVWIGTLEFEPRSPTDLLRLVPLRVSVDDRGAARAVDGRDAGGEQRVVALRWESFARESDRSSMLTIELEGVEGRSQIRLSMRRESRTWFTAPGDAGPSLRLKLATESARPPNAA